MKTIWLKNYYDNPCGDIEAVEVSNEVFELLIKFKREKNAQEKKDERHLRFAEYDDNSPDALLCDNQLPMLEELILKYEALKLKSFINALSDTQQSRIRAYFFEDLSYSQIARKEGVSRQAVQQNIKAIVANLFQAMRER